MKDWEARLAQARRLSGPCVLCERRCRVDRASGERGFCGAGPWPRLFRAALHWGDEPHLVPNYSLSFSGCNLRCAFCNVAPEAWDAGAGSFFGVEEHRTEAARLPWFDAAQVRDKELALYLDVQKYAFPVLTAQERIWTQKLFETFLTNHENWPFEPVPIHGDLDSSNILCDPERGPLLGVIDFEEACLGDPAWDFCALSAEFGPAFLQTLLNAYRLRLDAGLKPACVTICTTHCLQFGKADQMTDIRRQRYAQAVAE